MNKEILPINTQEAAKTLSEINLIAVAGRKNCWPIPPESGLAYALAIKKQNKNENNKINSQKKKKKKKKKGRNKQ